MKLPLILLLTIFCSVVAQAASPAETLAQMEAAVVNEDAETAQKLWKDLSPHFDRLSTADQGRYLVVQGLIQEDVLGDIGSADQSFNRAISLLDGAPVPTQALADAYYERGYIKYIRTHDTAVYCPDRVKAVALTRKLNTLAKLPRYLTSLSFCYTDSPQRFQQGLVTGIDQRIVLQQKSSAELILFHQLNLLHHRLVQYIFGNSSFTRFYLPDEINDIDNPGRRLLRPQDFCD